MSKGFRDVKVFLNDILEAINNIEEYIGNISYEDFLSDKKTRDAVIRNLEIIGEAAKNIPDDIKKKYNSVNWKAASGMRDKLIHEYFGVSFPIVWQTIINDLPPFKIEIEKILEDFK